MDSALNKVITPEMLSMMQAVSDPINDPNSQSEAAQSEADEGETLEERDEAICTSDDL